MSDEKKIEFSQSDVLNALLHQRNHEQHYATQDNVDNVKDNLARFEKQTNKQFESVEQEIKEIKDVKQEIKDVKQEIKDVSSKLDKLLFCGYRKPRVYPWMNVFGDGTMDKCNITPHRIVSTTRSIT